LYWNTWKMNLKSLAFLNHTLLNLIINDKCHCVEN
jgi:hypothetical protein